MIDIAAFDHRLIIGANASVVICWINSDLGGGKQWIVRCVQIATSADIIVVAGMMVVFPRHESIGIEDASNGAVAQSSTALSPKCLSLPSSRG